MRIRNAYVVYIDFDGDIYSEVEGYYIFAGEDAIDEVKKLVRQAFIDLFSKKSYMYCDIDGYSISIKDVINNDELLECYIEHGNSCFGNWTIEVDKVD